MAYSDEAFALLGRNNGSAMVTYLLLKGTGKLILETIQLISRMHKAHLLKKGEVESFKNFIRLSKGEYHLYSVPFSEKDKEPLREGFSISEKKLNQIKEDLNKLGIHYCIMPDLNTMDRAFPIAIMKSDEQKFAMYFESYIKNSLMDNPTITDMRNLLEDQVSIITIPKGAEKTLTESLKQLNIPYQPMPELLQSSLETHILVPQREVSRVTQIYNIIRQDALNKLGLINDEKVRSGWTAGKDIVPEIQVTDFKAYSDQAKISNDSYLNNLDRDVKQMQESFDKESKPLDALKEDPTKLNHLHSLTAKEFLEDPTYDRIVLKFDEFANPAYQPDIARGYMESVRKYNTDKFVFRVPMGKPDEIGIISVNKHHVFEFLDGDEVKFMAFLKPHEKVNFLSFSGDQVRSAGEYSGQQVKQMIDEQILSKTKDSLTKQPLPDIHMELDPEINNLMPEFKR